MLVDLFARLTNPNAQKSVPDLGLAHIFVEKLVLNTYFPVINIRQCLLFAQKIDSKHDLMTSTLRKYEIFLRLVKIFPQKTHLNVHPDDIFLGQDHSNPGLNHIFLRKCYISIRQDEAFARRVHFTISLH